jgi:hypothetical protein
MNGNKKYLENKILIFYSRIKTLFSRKNLWTLSELEPFLSNLTTSNAELISLLAIHTRSIIKDGQKYYVPKYS